MKVWMYDWIDGYVINQVCLFMSKSQPKWVKFCAYHAGRHAAKGGGASSGSEEALDKTLLDFGCQLPPSGRQTLIEAQNSPQMRTSDAISFVYFDSSMLSIWLKNRAMYRGRASKNKNGCTVCR